MACEVRKLLQVLRQLEMSGMAGGMMYVRDASKCFTAMRNWKSI